MRQVSTSRGEAWVVIVLNRYLLGAHARAVWPSRVTSQAATAALLLVGVASCASLSTRTQTNASDESAVMGVSVMETVDEAAVVLITLTASLGEVGR